MAEAGWADVGLQDPISVENGFNSSSVVGCLDWRGENGVSPRGGMKENAQM